MTGETSMIKRATIAVLCAVAFAALLSRVNRPVSPPAWERGTDFLHTPITRIEIDLTSLGAAAQSITRATGVEIRIPPDRKDAVFTPPGSGPSARRLALTNVTLSSVLDHLAAMPYSPPIIGYRVEGNVVVLDSPGERRPADDHRTFTRVYDVRDLVSHLRAWNDRVSRTYPPPAPASSRPASSSGLFGVSFPPAPPQSDDFETADVIASFYANSGLLDSFAAQSAVPREAHPFPGFVIVVNTEEGHRRFEKLLSLIRAQDSNAVLRAAGTP